MFVMWGSCFHHFVYKWIQHYEWISGVLIKHGDDVPHPNVSDVHVVTFEFGLWIYKLVFFFFYTKIGPESLRDHKNNRKSSDLVHNK